MSSNDGLDTTDRSENAMAPESFFSAGCQYAELSARADGASFASSPSIPIWKLFMTTSVLALGTVGVSNGAPIDLSGFENVSIVVPNDVHLVMPHGVECLGYGDVEIAPDYGPEALSAASISTLQSVVNSQVPDTAFDPLELGD